MFSPNVILSGHCGLIGKTLEERLKKEYKNVIHSIDIRSGSDINQLDSLELDKDLPIYTFIHLAAYCKIAEGIENPELIFESNVKGMHSVMEFVRKNNIEKIIYTSSSRVLSKEKNVYTASKIYGEELVKGYQKCYGIDYIIIRPSTVYGPGEDLTRRLITEWVERGLKNEELPIFGDKNKTLDFTYISDFIDGFMLTHNKRNKVFNISGEEEVKLVDLAEIIKKETGGGYVKFYKPEVAQPQKVRCDTSAIKALGYEPKVKLEEGVKKVVDWYRQHPEVWKK